MTETADKLRKKIYRAAESGSAKISTRGAENFNSNNETVINNIQVSGDIKRNSVEVQPLSPGAPLSKRDRDILRGSKGNSIRSPNHLVEATKST